MELEKLDLARTGSLAVERVVNGPIETNTYFAIADGECIVVDPAWEGEKLARHFAAAHPDVRVTALVCTHAHADHVGGVAGMRRALGDSVPFVISAADAPNIALAIEGQRQRWGIDTEVPPAPDRLLAEGDVIEVGSVRLQVIATPGHTPGGIVLFAATESGDIAFVGDTLFPGSHGRTDLEGGDERVMLDTLAKLACLLPEDTRCLIGHGPDTTMAAELSGNPFMAGVQLA